MIRVVILSGYGFNCEEETSFAFSLASPRVKADIVHVNDIVGKPDVLEDYQILCIPGGFSYGDHTGSGNAITCYLNHHLKDAINKFRQQDKLLLGICNGCQVLVRLFPEDFPVSLGINDSKIYQCEWVDLAANKNNDSIWCKNIDKMHIPIAHGEGKFSVNKEKSVNVALKYLSNPNGSDLNIAALSSHDGKILAMMPHPERAVLFSQQDNWPLLRAKHMRNKQSVPKYGDGINIFCNAITYFK